MKKNIIIGIGADHQGYAMKEFLKNQTTIGDFEITWQDVGAQTQDRTDYPVFAIEVSKRIQGREIDYGVLLCGTGVGMAVTANRFTGVYAGLAWNPNIARAAKEDDNINVLVLPSEYIDDEDALEMIQIWLAAEFKKGRYAERIALIDNINANF